MQRVFFFFQNMKDLVSKTVPDNIRLKREMNLEEPYGKSEQKTLEKYTEELQPRFRHWIGRVCQVIMSCQWDTKLQQAPTGSALVCGFESLLLTV